MRRRSAHCDVGCDPPLPLGPCRVRLALFQSAGRVLGCHPPPRRIRRHGLRRHPTARDAPRHAAPSGGRPSARARDRRRPEVRLCSGSRDAPRQFRRCFQAASGRLRAAVRASGERGSTWSGGRAGTGHCVVARGRAGRALEGETMTMARQDTGGECDIRGHRFDRENKSLCIRCGLLSLPPAPIQYVPVHFDSDDMQCAMRLRPYWEARCSRSASRTRAGVRFCHQHDPGEGVTSAQAAAWAASSGKFKE